jgi:hypothetical protein
VFNKIRKISGKHTDNTITALINPENHEVTSDAKKISNILAKHFQTVTSNSNYDPKFLSIKQEAESTIINTDGGSGETYNQLFSLDELEAALISSKRSSPGPDDVHYDMLKHLPSSAKTALLNMYNEIWESRTFPKEWTESIIVPI